MELAAQLQLQLVGGWTGDIFLATVAGLYCLAGEPRGGKPLGTCVTLCYNTDRLPSIIVAIIAQGALSSALPGRSACC